MPMYAARCLADSRPLGKGTSVADQEVTIDNGNYFFFAFAAADLAPLGST